MGFTKNSDGTFLYAVNWRGGGGGRGGIMRIIWHREADSISLTSFLKVDREDHF